MQTYLGGVVEAPTNAENGTSEDYEVSICTLDDRIYLYQIPRC